MRNVFSTLLLVVLFIGCGGDEESSVPAVFLNATPTNGSTVTAMGGVLLKFNKRPENVKIEPSLQFYVGDEISKRKKTPHLANIRLPAMLDSSVLILGPLATPDRVSTIKVYWGTERPQQFVSLGYFVQGPDRGPD